MSLWSPARATISGAARPSRRAKPSRADRSSPRYRRKRKRRYRRLAGALVLASPALWIVLTDLIRRPTHIGTFDRLHALGYAATAVASLLFWAVLLYAAARRRGVWSTLSAGLFAVLFTLAVGVQGGFHSFYNTYLCLDSQVYSQSLVGALLGEVPLWKPLVALHLVGATALSLLLLGLARRIVRPRPWGRRLGVLLVPVALVGVGHIEASFRIWQATTPDIIYFHGFLALVEERLRLKEHAPHLRVQRRKPEPVPAMTAEPARPRNVLLVVQESVRADMACSGYLEDDQDCPTRASNRAAPGRMPLFQLRANAATTAISISNLWSGVPAYEGFELLHSVPLLWDYAHAAGWYGAYWTSQNVMFGSMRLYVQDLPVSLRAVGTELDSRADFDAGANDALLTDRAIADWAELREPFFAVVQYSNGHFPYVYDPNQAPFQPSELTKAPDKNARFLNYFRNVIYLSDKATGRLIEHVRSTDSGKRTIIIYTSDHGEAFREHWQLGHTSSLYDEEIHVPGWIDAPAGTLTAAEEAAIRGAAEQYVWHLDIAPTVLDLMGLWDRPELGPFRARMIGHPLTRPERTTGLVPLTNCSWLWECAFRNWGLMQGPLKVEAREWDNEFHCFDLSRDPAERHNLGERACAPLPQIARATFGAMPRQKPPSRKDLLWGAPAPSGSAKQ